jgi:hypothetical protein
LIIDIEDFLFLRFFSLLSFAKQRSEEAESLIFSFFALRKSEEAEFLIFEKELVQLLKTSTECQNSNKSKKIKFYLSF